MHIVYSSIQATHQPSHEFHCGELVPYFEQARRSEEILTALQDQGMAELAEPPLLNQSDLCRVHDPDFVEFVATAFQRWQDETGVSSESLLPHVWPRQGMSHVRPDSLFGQLGFYSFDSATPITQHSFAASLASVSSAVHAADLLLKTERTSFALCRPPGHHVGPDYYGGYGLLNSAAMAAQHLAQQTKGRIAILDIDYHHGNGTQDIFYEREDVLYVSIHADPKDAYPYFLGHSEEQGKGMAKGTNLNLPLAKGTTWREYGPALDDSLRCIKNFDAAALVISLGVDTYKEDPISEFQLDTDDYKKMGSKIGQLRIPKLVCMEGGYAIDKIGENVVTFLKNV